MPTPEQPSLSHEKSSALVVGVVSQVRCDSTNSSIRTPAGFDRGQDQGMGGSFVSGGWPSTSPAGSPVASARGRRPTSVPDRTETLMELTQVRPLRWEFDPTLVRGMGYYTGQIFEISHPASSSSLAGGGRYDKLIGRWLGRNVPACGFSLGFERIVDLLTPTPQRDALAVLVETDVSLSSALARACAARADGRTVAVIRRSGKLPAQLNRLQTWGYTAFIHLRTESPDGTIEPERPLSTANQP